MVSHINIQYVYRYYTAAILYGLPELEKYCLEWYQYNLMLNKRNHRMLQEIDVKLMKEIIIYALHFILQVLNLFKASGLAFDNINERKSFLTLTFAFFKLKWIFIICLLTGYFSS